MCDDTQATSGARNRHLAKACLGQAAAGPGDRRLHARRGRPPQFGTVRGVDTRDPSRPDRCVHPDALQFSVNKGKHCPQQAQLLQGRGGPNSRALVARASQAHGDWLTTTIPAPDDNQTCSSTSTPQPRQVLHPANQSVRLSTPTPPRFKLVPEAQAVALPASNSSTSTPHSSGSPSHAAAGSGCPRPSNLWGAHAGRGAQVALDRGAQVAGRPEGARRAEVLLGGVQRRVALVG